MHWLSDFIAAGGVVLNGIPQGIFAMSLGFAIFPTAFSFILVSIVNGFFLSPVPVSFQAESLALTGNLGNTRRERTSIIFGGSVIMAVIGLTSSLTKIVSLLGRPIIDGMMAGVGVMLAKIAVDMAKKEKKTGWGSIALAAVCYLITKNLVWTIIVSVIFSTLFADVFLHYRKELPKNITVRRFIFTKPAFNFKVIRGALGLACLNIGANISYGLITGQMTHIHPNPVKLNVLTSGQALADMGTSLLGGAPVETIISATGSAPEPVLAGIIMMVIMAIILLLGWLPKMGKFIPAASIAGFLFILGAVVTFPENASLAFSSAHKVISALVLIITAIFDPFSGLVVGGVLKFVLPIFHLEV